MGKNDSGSTNTSTLKAIQECRLLFLENNEDPRKMKWVRPEVAESWIVSKKLGIDPYAGRLGADLPDQKLKYLLKEKELLIQAAIPYIEQLETLLVQSGYIIALTDARGVILYAKTDNVLEITFRQLNGTPGKVWSPELVGTCSHVLCSYLKKPVQLSGPEHYCDCFLNTTCSSAPIFDEFRNFVGTLSMCNGVNTTNPHTIGLVTSLAWAIQNELILKIKNTRVRLKDRKSSVKTDNDCSDSGLIQIFPNDNGNNAIADADGAGARFSFKHIIGTSPGLLKTIEKGAIIASTPANALIYGETGTGKELFAQAIHNMSAPNGPFIVVNCAALPNSLIESELFGYEGGSFTGADRKGRPGR